MIPPAVNDHVVSRHHVTVDASRLIRCVTGVFDDSELRRQVTLRTDVVGVRACDKLSGMWIVTITAGDGGPVHFALQEGAVDVDLIENLPVREVQCLIK